MPSELIPLHRPEGVLIFKRFLDAFKLIAGVTYESSDNAALLRGVLLCADLSCLIGVEDLDEVMALLPASDYDANELLADHYSPETRRIVDELPADVKLEPRFHLDRRLRDYEWARGERGWPRDGAIAWKAFYRVQNFLGELSDSDYAYLLTRLPKVQFQVVPLPFEVLEDALKRSPLVLLPKVFAGPYRRTGS